MKPQDIHDLFGVKLTAAMTTLGWAIGTFFKHADQTIELITHFAGMVAAVFGALLMAFKYFEARRKSKKHVDKNE